jgi:hypothetical protein
LPFFCDGRFGPLFGEIQPSQRLFFSPFERVDTPQAKAPMLASLTGPHEYRQGAETLRVEYEGDVGRFLGKTAGREG